MPNETTCVCGRSWVHCPNCGSANLYPLKLRSKYSGEKWFTCKKCSNEFKEGSACVAPQEIYKSDVKPGRPKEPSIVDTRPQFILHRDSDDYTIALVKRWNELADEGKLKTKNEIRTEMQSEGWDFANESPSTSGDSVRDSDAKTSEGPIFTPVALDEIMKRMKETK